MKRILLLVILGFFVIGAYGQKITELTAATSAAGTNNILTATTGSDLLKRITKAQFLIDYVAVTDTSTMLAPYIIRGDTAAMLLPYALTSEISTDYISPSDTASMLTPYINRSDTADMLDNYITTAETSASYAPIASPTFTTQITIGANAITETTAGYLDPTSSVQGQIDAKAPIANADLTGSTTAEDLETAILSVGDGGNIVSLDSITSASSDVKFYNGADTLSPYIPYSARSTDVARTIADEMLYFTVVVGAGNAGDTVLFSTGDVIFGTKWGTDYNLVITKVTAVNGAGSKDIDINLYHDDNFKDATPTEVLSADLTVTSSTTGDDGTSFDSATIAPSKWLWIKVNEATAQPTQCIINIYGYLTEL